MQASLWIERCPKVRVHVHDGVCANMVAKLWEVIQSVALSGYLTGPELAEAGSANIRTVARLGEIGDELRRLYRLPRAGGGDGRRDTRRAPAGDAASSSGRPGSSAGGGGREPDRPRRATRDP